MRVRWTLRAANDRRRSSPRIKSRHPHQRQETLKTLRFWGFLLFYLPTYSLGRRIVEIMYFGIILAFQGSASAIFLILYMQNISHATHYLDNSSFVKIYFIIVYLWFQSAVLKCKIYKVWVLKEVGDLMCYKEHGLRGNWLKLFSFSSCRLCI